MVVESNVPMQDILRERLKKRGYRVLITSDPDRALARFAESPQVADCAIFCTSELEEAAVDAFNRFSEAEATKDTPSILLLHQKQQTWLEQARPTKQHVVLVEAKLSELRAVLLRLLKQPSETRP
jgi:CheY-like chemotaxis protein